MDPQRLLDGLDPAQRRAVTSTAQPLAILAGPGSGKTRVLTRRIAHRCLTGSADPRHVLAVTFTRKAAGELDQRLAQFGLRDLPAAGTFHALAYAQLRTAWAHDNRTPPTLLDRKSRILGQVLGSSRQIRAIDLAAEIEWSKARLIGPDGYAEAARAAGRQPPGDPQRIADWYRAYEDRKAKRGLVDFDDLLALAAARIERDPVFASAQRWRFRHLFVDEYQDVNPLQERLLRAWLGDRPDLCVVGDPDQAIYSWNGADASYLRDFTRHHPGSEMVELDRSYRSTPQVLAVAAQLRPGSRRAPFVPCRGDGPLPAVVGYQRDSDEALGVARAIRELHGPGRAWGDQAVLVRTHAQAALFEEAFRRAAIPYRLRGGTRLLDDPDVARLLSRMEANRDPLVATLDDLEESIVEQRELLAGGPDLDGPQVARVELPHSAEGQRLEMTEQVVRLGRELLAADPGARTDALPGWLRTMMVSDAPESGDAVTIATFHAAKGLEWSIVHVAGCEVGYVPISHARTSEARAEEERLFYVAVTRAADQLRCTWARERTFTSDPVERAPSPLLTKVRSAIAELERRSTSSIAPPAALSEVRSHLAPTEPDALSRQQAIAADLRRWRAEQARKASVRPTVVLSDRAIDALARHQPSSSTELAELPGVGPFIRSRHGDQLLAMVAAHTSVKLESADHREAP